MARLEKKDVCVLIPAFNEERNIAVLVDEVRKMGFPVLVCDDGSQDRTSENARSAGAALLSSKQNQGKGAVLRRGLDWVLEKNFKAVILMDADGQHDPRELESFLEALNRKEGDVVVGNRMPNASNMPFVRRTTNRLLSMILSKVSKQFIPDSQCGYRALTRAVLNKVQLKTNRFEIESEILLEASRKGCKIVSIPISSIYRGTPSKIHAGRDTVRFFSFLFSYLKSAQKREKQG